MSILKFMQGKKTYTAAGLLIAGIVLNACGVPIPPQVFEVLGVFGFGAIVAKFERLVKKD